MKYFVILLAVVAFAFASDDGCTETSVVIDPGTSGSDGVAFTVVNDWTLTYQAIGLDVYMEPTNIYILAVNNTDHLIHGYDETGSPAGTMALDPANASCFGVAWNNNSDTPTYYTDDWADNVLYYTDDLGSTWTTVTNPAGNQARGMDFDGTDYWTTNGNGGGIWRFQPGVGQENIATPEIPSQPSGLTVFPYGSNLGIAITTYNTHNIYFYQWDGSTLDFMASEPCPVACSYSYGLGYCAANDHMYWTYKSTSSQYHLAELDFTITALQRSSWASIKTSF